MTDEPKAPPGWYPTPEGGQRYWDGKQWTNHMAPGATTNVAVPPKRLSPTKTFGGILAGIFALVVISSSLDSGTTARDATSQTVRSPNAYQKPVSLSGDGEVNTKPFALAPGEYEISWKTLGERGSRDCLYYGSLEGTKSDFHERIFKADGAMTGSNHFYNVPKGEYYVEVNTSQVECGWSMTLKPAG